MKREKTGSPMTRKNAAPAPPEETAPVQLIVGALALAAMVVVVFLLVFGGKPGQTQPPTTIPTPLSTMPAPTAVAFPAPTRNPNEGPGADARPIKQPTPTTDPTVSVQTLDETYRLVRKALADRDYPLFASHASKDVLASLGQQKDGLLDELQSAHNSLAARIGVPARNESGTRSVGDYWLRFGPESTRQPYLAPPTDSISAATVVSSTEHREPIPSNYSLLLSYADSGGAGATPAGWVAFIKEKCVWKYAGESQWVFDYPTLQQFGDTASVSHPLTWQTPSPNATRYPESVSIRPGEAVTWVNLTGYVYSYDTPQPWYSSVVIQGNYTKRFDEQGAYYYSVRSVLAGQQPKYFVGVVIVQ